MAGYPKGVRDAKMKCLSCNAPVVETISDHFVCVECGQAPIERKTL
jgi:predicted RNA-binding Zn-ribbon protein involved in translation (DUF1610 family)